ncbi:SRPBCC family protein [Streptomyces sp. NPDC052701]|uniref:SRPBCC family protein n=1 Tax=Streptomyces sp. NPDC052701 TaxID=3155533 RepID=UPI0034230E94
MWQHAYSADAGLAPEAIWTQYASTGTWPTWNAGMVKLDLEGPFETGSTGRVASEGQPPASSTLSDVTEGEGFTIDVQLTDELTSRSDCRVTALPGGGSRITHTVEFTGPGSEQMGAAHGEVLAGNIAAGVEALVEAAR